MAGHAFSPRVVVDCLKSLPGKVQSRQLPSIMQMLSRELEKAPAEVQQQKEYQDFAENVVDLTYCVGKTAEVEQETTNDLCKEFHSLSLDMHKANENGQIAGFFSPSNGGLTVVRHNDNIKEMVSDLKVSVGQEFSMKAKQIRAEIEEFRKLVLEAAANGAQQRQPDRFVQTYEADINVDDGNVGYTETISKTTKVRQAARYVEQTYKKSITVKSGNVGVTFN